MKKFTRATALVAGVGWGITALFVHSTGVSNASPDYCTPAVPYAPYNAVCDGPGSYCSLGLACSPVPGEPGTRNPGGYTPCPPSYRSNFC